MGDELVTYDFLGLRLTPVTRDQILGYVSSGIEKGQKLIIASQNLHGVYTFLTDAKFRVLHKDSRTCVHIDGTSIIWLGRLLGLPLGMRHRTGVVDWFMPLMEVAARNCLRVYYLGGEAEVLEKGLNRIRNRVPGLDISGHQGFFDAEAENRENRAIVDEINAIRPHILFVGMGMGRQERWIVDNLRDLEVNCVATSGACMEVIAGKLSVAPRWMACAGVEWLFRLLQNPRRMWWRYLVEPWLVAGLLLRNRFLFGTWRCE